MEYVAGEKMSEDLFICDVVKTRRKGKCAGM